MVRSIFATVILAVLVAGAFGGLFGGSNQDEQINREHKRQQPQKIRQCNCEQQQRQFFNEMKQYHQQCYQMCTDQQTMASTQMMPQETREAMQTARDCSRQAQRQAQEAFECMDQKMQEKKSCQQQSQQEETENRDSAVQFADHFERMTNKARQMMEESYEQMQNTQEQRFGKVFANQVYDCTNKCMVQKARQMDNSQRNSCEFKFDTDSMKQAMGECKQKHFQQAIEQMCQCATQKSQQQQYGAQPFCQQMKEKKFDADAFFKQY